MAVTVQKGTLALGSGSTSDTVTITSVTMANAILRFSYKVDSNSTSVGLIRGVLTNATTLTFQRTASGAAATIEWVVEESTDFTVQRGVASISAPGPSVNVTITAVNLSKAYAIVSNYAPGSALGSDDPVMADLTTTTNLQLSVGRTDLIDPVANIAWQVVERSDATVQKITHTVDAQLETEAITSVTMNKTFLVGSGKVVAGITTVGGDELPIWYLSDVDELSFERVDSGASATFVVLVYVVSISGDIRVQRGETAFASGDNSEDVVLSSVDTDKTAVHLMGYTGAFGNSSDVSDELGTFAYAANLTSATAANISRANGTGDTGKIAWEAIEWDYVAPGGGGGNPWNYYAQMA